jgi:phosphoribosylformylglycinamidine (FGAM) synthase-like amidotransferase family enzyme
LPQTLSSRHDFVHRNKELERILKTNGINLSVDKVLAIAKTITTIYVKMPHCENSYTKTMLVTNRHKLIARLFDDDFWNRVPQ